MCSPSQSLFSSSRLPFPPDRTRTSCALVELWPTYLAYLVSFSTIGAVWFGHTVITEYLDHADSVLIRLNLLLLLVVSFHSFPTKLLADYTNEAGPERIAAGAR